MYYATLHTNMKNNRHDARTSSTPSTANEVSSLPWKGTRMYKIREVVTGRVPQLAYSVTLSRDALLAAGIAPGDWVRLRVGKDGVIEVILAANGAD